MAPLRRARKALAVALALQLLLGAWTALAHKPSFSDCLSDPFSRGCRGISAKRSGAPAGLPASLMGGAAQRAPPALASLVERARGAQSAPTAVFALQPLPVSGGLCGLLLASGQAASALALAGARNE